MCLMSDDHETTVTKYLNIVNHNDRSDAAICRQHSLRSTTLV